MNLETEARRVSALEGEISHWEKTVENLWESLAKTKSKLDHAKQAQEILQLISQAVQERVHRRISEVVSSCLSAVFDDPYTFQIQFERKRGRTEARLRFLRRGMDVDPLTASGGGMIDVAAFALRVACLVLHRPRLSRILVADEPFRFVSEEYQDNIRSMLEELAEDMGIQIIMVTHNEAYETGKVIEL